MTCLCVKLIADATKIKVDDFVKSADVAVACNIVVQVVNQTGAPGPQVQTGVQLQLILNSILKSIYIRNSCCRSLSQASGCLSLALTHQHQHHPVKVLLFSTYVSFSFRFLIVLGQLSLLRSCNQ